MHLYFLKNKFFCLFILIFVSSCIKVIEDPAKKYNDEFLRTNSRKINRMKQKHLKIAKEQGIYYRKNETDSIDPAYYKNANGTKIKKSYRNNNIEEDNKKAINYIDDELSIYYKQRNLKDDDLISLNEDRDHLILYLAENYTDYSKEKIGFSDIEISSEKLYGSLKLRKEKDYRAIDYLILQENFDYIDVMNRVKKELYLENKQKQQTNTIKENATSIKNRFMDLFK